MTTGIHRLTGGLALVLLATAGCASDAHPQRPIGASPTGTPEPAAAPVAARAVPFDSPLLRLPTLAQVNGRDATAISRAALIRMWLVDSAVDRGQYDAYLRALPFLTRPYAAQIRNEQEASSPDPVWAEHRAYARVRLSLGHDSGGPAQTATRAFRQWAVTISPQGRDGWTGSPTTVTAWVSLQRSARSHRWQVSAVEIGS